MTTHNLLVTCSINPLYTEWNIPHYILEEFNFNYRYVWLCDLGISYRKKAKLFSNSGDPDQRPCSAASDLGLHCLQIIHLGVSRLQWANIMFLSSVLMHSVYFL